MSANHAGEGDGTTELMRGAVPPCFGGQFLGTDDGALKVQEGNTSLLPAALCGTLPFGLRHTTVRDPPFWGSGASSYGAMAVIADPLLARTAPSRAFAFGLAEGDLAQDSSIFGNPLVVTVYVGKQRLPHHISVAHRQLTASRASYALAKGH